ncbi:MAG: VCBS repeat-containing protein [Acidobacteria bacterium]|nr:VCBS repeat-containing protein [Acidobacteriota bacterium]
MLSASAVAQQGGLDLGWGLNGSGAYVDPPPATIYTDNTNFGSTLMRPDGKTVVVGVNWFSSGGDLYNNWYLKRLNADGSLDTSFGTGGFVKDEFWRYGSAPLDRVRLSGATAALQSDNKIVVVSTCAAPYPTFPSLELHNGYCLSRYNENGTVDTSFGGNTVTISDCPATTPTQVTLPAGRIWGYAGSVNGNEACNAGLGTPLIAALKIGGDGRIYIFGTQRNNNRAGSGTNPQEGFVAIHNANGSRQSISVLPGAAQTPPNFDDIVFNDGVVLSNGGFVAVGRRQFFTSQTLIWNGTQSFVFGPGASPNDKFTSIVQTRGNKFVIGGILNGNETHLRRYNSDLSLDTTFGTAGDSFLGSLNPGIGSSGIFGLSMQPDGKILGNTIAALVRTNPNGSLDLSIGRPDIPNQLAWRGFLPSSLYQTTLPTANNDHALIYGGIGLRSSGRIVTGGSTGNVEGWQQGAVTQLRTFLEHTGRNSDFDNDGVSDYSVFRPSDGVWHNLNSFSGSYSPAQFGLSGDKIVPADYDGDGKTDRAVFRNGLWWVLPSTNSQPIVFSWGLAGDIPRPGDFNGDGYADFAVFRPSSGTWYIYYSAPIQPGNVAYSIVNFGAGGDIPLIADFDGDGKSDISVFRNGTWYFIRSTDLSIGIVSFGLTGDVPVVGDYDGDGKTDFAVFRNGVWYILRSSNASLMIQSFGIAGDKPVPGDYDNDGLDDPGIFRNGVWWTFRSASNTVGVTTFGLATDVPLQSAYIQ